MCDCARLASSTSGPKHGKRKKLLAGVTRHLARMKGNLEGTTVLVSLCLNSSLNSSDEILQCVKSQWQMCDLSMAVLQGLASSFWAQVHAVMFGQK